jgi:serine protease Do
LKAFFPVLSIVACALSGCVSTGGASQQAVIRAKDSVAPALVHVSPVKEVFRRGERKEVPVTGSGFIITPDGYVVTNEHVAGKLDYVRCVLFDKDEVEAEVVGTDPFTDIAVLKLRTDRTDLPYVKLGESGILVAGETVLAMGSPHGLARSVSMGIVSVTDRNLERLGASGAPYNNWIQTDAAINPGNSGGPLVNIRGEVIGINTRKLTGADNLGFAIPMDIAREVIDEIIRTGKVTRSTVGISFQEMTRITDDPSRSGVVVSDVDPLLPAYKAHIRPGDILLAIDGVPTDARFTEDLPAIRKRVADTPVGESITLTIQRQDQVVDVPVTTVELSQKTGRQVEFEKWGFTASDLTDPIIRRAQLRSKDGIFVSGIRAGESAAQAGLQQGDIVLKMDDTDITDLAQFNKIYDELVEAKKKLVLLTVKRGALTMFRLIKQDTQPQTAGS